MATAVETTFEALCQHFQQIAKLTSAQAALEWDAETTAPDQSREYRAGQVSELARLIHTQRTAPQVGEWLTRLAEYSPDPTTRAGCIIRQLQRDYDRQTRLSSEFVAALSHATSLGQHVWAQARKNRAFGEFLPSLETILALKKEQASALGFERTPYEPLLDEFEPGAKVPAVAQVLQTLVAELKQLLQEIQASGKQPSRKCLAEDYSVARQRRLARSVCKQIGFDFQRGALGVTTHPFCSTLGPHDIRLTTRYQRHSFGDAFYSALHEAGHGLYEQGLPTEDFGLPTGEAVSLGVHESQSRMWENVVGRSLPFWQYMFPQVRNYFPTATADYTAEDYFAAANRVEPSLIRVEADEVTYNAHIVIRFELEIELLEGKLQAADLPSAWNAKYQAYLGIVPQHDAEGVLQDVHWSAGLFGYFATYALGNLYAAQLFAQAQVELGDLHALFAQGDFAPLRHWLLVNIHRQGRRWSSAELIQRVARRELASKEFMGYLRQKLTPLYGL